MPLSFSNVVPKLIKTGLTTAANAVIPGSGTLASMALSNKINPPAATPLAPVATAAAKPMVKPAVSSSDPSTLALQKQLNAKNAGQAGWTPLVEDGQLGPKTQAAQSWQPTAAPVYTPPSQQNSNGTTPPAKTNAPADEKPSFGGILMDLIKKATEGSQGVQQARENLTKFQTGTADKIAAIRSDDIPLEFQQGRAQVVQQASAEKEKALETGVSNALADQQQQLTALGAAGNLAQPIQSPYSNQVLDPTTGLPIGGGAAGGSLQDAITSIADKVRNGTMGYDAGVAALQGYGQAGINGLQTSLGPNFNIQQSNAQAAAQAATTLQTGTTGGVITKAADSANQALTKLETDFGNLSKYQTNGIPFTNSIANWFATKGGQGALAAYQTTLADARAQIVGVLTASGAATPTGAEDIAKTYLPDDMTPALLKEKIAAVRTLITQKVASATSATPVANNNTGGTTGAIIKTKYGDINPSL